MAAVGTGAAGRGKGWFRHLAACVPYGKNGPVTAFICRLDQPGSGPRIAVKDLIDIAGVPTTAGCKALADTAAPAARDAACMAGARAAERPLPVRPICMS